MKTPKIRINGTDLGAVQSTQITREPQRGRTLMGIPRHEVREDGEQIVLAMHPLIVRQLCQEVDLLAPAVQDGRLRQDNCEYPWEVVDT